MPLVAVALAVALAGAVEVPGETPNLPHLKYDGGDVSSNDRCPVRHGKLNPAIAPLYVNGRAVGFC